jgi:hypothetical protein
MRRLDPMPGSTGKPGLVADDGTSFDESPAHFMPVTGADHFSVLAPTTRLIAKKVLCDDGPESNIAFTAEELKRPFAAGDEPGD